MRLAWFTPLPPERSGISAYSAELLPMLTDRFSIDVYCDAPPAAAPAGTRAFDAHDFVWRHDQQAYDLAVYQLGNATCHDYIWPYLFRYPGLVVLHDGQLHHARARLLLQQGRYADYRAEFKHNHPDVRQGVADLGIVRLLGSLHYLWPMLRSVVESARLVAVHSPGLAADLAAKFPDRPIAELRMGVPARVPTVAAADLRSRYGVPAGAVVFAAFGRVTPEKRISQILQALAALGDQHPPIHLWLVGEAAPYYDALAEARTLGIADRVTMTGFVNDDELAGHLSAADVCLCLRWPTARETSASWLRCLAAGKPTVTTDLVHTVEVPSLDPRTWKPQVAPRPCEDGPDAGPVEPICVSLDILDEDHSLRLALRRLTQDAPLRVLLGRRAHEYWQRNHTLPRMTEDYESLIDRALAAPVPTPELPTHLRPTGLQHALAVADEGGFAGDPFV